MMKNKIGVVCVILLLTMVIGCTPKPPATPVGVVTQQEVIGLVCGSQEQASCLKRLCDSLNSCPLMVALSNQAVFDFVKTYAACDDCNTPDQPLGEGIGKCIEFSGSESNAGSVLTFWVSENCNFRYGSPSQSRITVQVSARDNQIQSISPSVEYIQDPTYCQVNADCDCLSGSGLPFVGCSNFLYAPLNIAGYYPGDQCRCESHQCVQK
jgi:hypothetical protein